MRKFVIVSRSGELPDRGSSDLVTLFGRSGSIAHQFDCVHGNEPTPQTMVQLIGCQIEIARPHGRRESPAASNSSGPSTARA
jgi:hypothetical protein